MVMSVIAFHHVQRLAAVKLIGGARFGASMATFPPWV
jgi:hypothetical protein